MAASVTLPTQALPPYLSASTFTLTEGGVVSTGVSTVGVPLTYFGPSIPLGPDDVWTFGGSTSPPSTSSTALSTTATSAIPSSNTPSSNSQPTSSSSSAASHGSGPLSSAGPTATSSAINGSKKHLSGGAIGGIVIAAVVFLVLLLTLICFLAVRRRRKRDQQQHLYANPNMSDFVIVDAEGHPRLAGEGVARPHGEEEDSFLHRAGSDDDDDEHPRMRQRTSSALVVSLRASSGAETIGTIAAPEGIVPSALAPSGPSPDPTSPPTSGVKHVNSPFFHASASSLFFNPTRGPDPSVSGPAAAAGASKRDSASTQQSSGRSIPAIQGAIIPRHELLQMEGQWNQEAATEADAEAGATGIAGHRGVTELGERVADEDYPGTPLRPPPILNPDAIRPTSRPDSAALSIPDTPGSEDERATFLTARRVRMDEAGPSTFISRDASSSTSPSAWGSGLGGLGLGGLARLSRLSWFQRMEGAQGSPRHSVSSSSRERNGNDRRSRTTSPAPGLGVPRPLSHLSTGSRASSNGESNYHDALSTISTGSGHGHRGNSRSPSAPPPPVPSQAAAASEIAGQSTISHSINAERSLPAIPEPTQPSPAPTRSQRLSQSDNMLLDVLDTPVPRPTSSQFSSTSSRDGPMLPPGLEHLAVANVHSWRESGSDMPSPTSLTGSGGSAPTNRAEPADVLEDAPPRPRAGWTQLRSVAGATFDATRRATLGQSLLIDIDDTPRPDADRHYSSERGSVHSLPTSLPPTAHGRLSPFSPVGSGGSNSHSHSHSHSHSRHTPSTFGSGSSRSHYSQDSGHGHDGFFHGGAAAAGSQRSQRSLQQQLHHSSSITSGEQQRRFSRREPGEPLALSSASMQSLSALGAAPPISATGASMPVPARLSALGGSGIRLVGSSPPRLQNGPPPPELDPDATTFSSQIGTGVSVMSQTSLSNLSGASHVTRASSRHQTTEGQMAERDHMHMIVPIEP